MKINDTNDVLVWLRTIDECRRAQAQLRFAPKTGKLADDCTLVVNVVNRIAPAESQPIAVVSTTPPPGDD